MILEHVDNLILELSEIKKTSAKVDRTLRTASTLARNPTRTAKFVVDAIRENPRGVVFHTAKHIANIGAAATFGIEPADVVDNKERVSKIRQNIVDLKQKPIRSVGSIAKNLHFIKASLKPEPVVATLSAIHNAVSDGVSAVASTNKSKIRHIGRIEKAEADAAAKKRSDELQTQKEQAERNSFYDHQFYRRFQ